MKKLHFAFCAVLTTITIEAADRAPRSVEIIRPPSGSVLFLQSTASQRNTQSDASATSDSRGNNAFQTSAAAGADSSVVIVTPAADFGGRSSELIGPVFPAPILTPTGQPTGFATQGGVGGPGAVTPPLVGDAVAPGFPTGPGAVGAPQVPGSSVPLPPGNAPLAPPIAPSAPTPNVIPPPQSTAGPIQSTAGGIQSTAGGIQTTVPGAPQNTVPGVIQNGVIVPNTVPIVPGAPVGAAQAVPGQIPAAGSGAQNNQVPIGPGAGSPANTGGTGAAGGTTGGSGTR